MTGRIGVVWAVRIVATVASLPSSDISILSFQSSLIIQFRKTAVIGMLVRSSSSSNMDILQLLMGQAMSEIRGYA